MKLTETEKAEFQKAARPLIEWMAKNLHPHTKTIVTSVSAEIVEGVENFQTLEFYVDYRSCEMEALALREGNARIEQPAGNLIQA